ncbi:acyltransferase [Actinoplanes sp. NEAU-A12]|uniref:Acyltransferase n=1 Tax=Actinoplanes sandaracinus TaxID=3045177 RepID=A0ABT6WQA1_9ACTN|nr:acyltransferase [Actinoplanes sandaracinus]MDI6101903.1 acyltransferase [Actinoplanes sandaracinus]
MAEPNDASARRGRLAALDGLRLAAALMVVLYHYTGQISTAWSQDTGRLFPQVHNYTSYGWTGVYLFFVISGFVICMSGWNRPLRAFFISRVVRLYPAYWFAIIAVTVVTTFYPVIQKPAEPEQVLINLTMLQDPHRVGNIDAVYWTLWAELRFYLLFALVVWRGLTYRRVVAFCVLWTVASLFAGYSEEPMFRSLVQPESSSFFIGGVAIYLMHRFGQDILLWSIIGICFLRGQLYLTSSLPEMQKNTHAGGSWHGVTILLAVFYLLVIGVALGYFSWAKWRWLTAAGALTYPLYLLHEVIGWTVIKKLNAVVSAWPLTLGLIACMLVLSYLVNRFVEEPLAKPMKRALSKALDRLAADRSGSDTRPALNSPDDDTRRVESPRHGDAWNPWNGDVSGRGAQADDTRTNGVDSSHVPTQEIKFVHRPR